MPRREYLQSASLGDTFTIADMGCYRWGSAALSATPFDVADIGPGVSTSMPQGTYLGKRPRSVEGTSAWAEGINGHKPRPHKKAMGKMANRGVLEAAGSTSRARHKSSTKIPVQINHKSKAAGPGAGRLAAPNAQGVYHQSLPGPSARKELVGTTVQDQLPWAEGSEEEATRHYTSGVVQQQQALSDRATDGEDRHFRIPKRVSQRHRSLLDATPDDLARGTVQELKCRLCPGTGISNWDNFKRHCDFMEAHPLKISFCGYCGDFFARSDTLGRHQENRPPECLGVTEAEAEAKRTETKKVHDAFQEKLEKCLGNSGEAWTPFSQIIQAMFPNSSKKGSRQQDRTKAPKA